jgi:hypothetical protein
MERKVLILTNVNKNRIHIRHSGFYLAISGPLAM